LQRQEDKFLLPGPLACWQSQVDKNLLSYSHKGTAAMPPIRLLLVEDHEVARRSIRSVLSGNPNIEVIGETSEGEQAITKADELHPDVILLDISLPGISGIAAARSIIKIAPKSRIIFVSQHDSVRVAKDALSIGASGYVVKSDAGRDLIAAIEAALEGRTFVSRTLVAHGWS
jgi:DNA-binding NarL/FixJ family response regulator